MRKSFVSLVAAALSTAYLAAAAEEAVYDNGVLVLNEVSFYEAINEHDYMLVEFYAPWCGHCKELAPEFEAAAKILSKQDPKVVLSKVDATENENLAGQMEIDGYPTLFFYMGGEPFHYSGGGTSDEIVQWVQKWMSPSSREVDCAEMKEAVDASTLALSYFGPLDNELFAAFSKVAGMPKVAEYKSIYDAEKYEFLHTSDASCAEQFGVAAVPGIVLSRKFDEPRFQVQATDPFDIAYFISKKSTPSLMPFDIDAIEKVFYQGNPAIILMTEDLESDCFKEFSSAAKEMNDEIQFIYSGISEGDGQMLGQFFGLSQEDLPVMRIIDAIQEKRYNYEGNVNKLSIDDVSKFVSDYKAGSLTPFYMSEAVPAKHTTDGLTKLVGKSFFDFTKGTTKDLLVFYHVPWCENCQALQPKYETLAKELERADDLVIAKFDVTLNEYSGMRIESFPTLILFTNGDRTDGVRFEGEQHEISDLRKFLAEKSPVYNKFANQEKTAEGESNKTEEL